MADQTQDLQLLHAWVQLSGILKNTRFTKGLSYNEAIIMLLLYQRYRTDGIGMVSIKEIIQSTKMLKSLVNRTVNSLEEKGLLMRCHPDGDRRFGYVRCVEDKLSVFLSVHDESMRIAQTIISIIGAEDAQTFIQIVDKIKSAGFHLP